MVWIPVERVVLIGACTVDNILNVPHYPSEDEKLRCTGFTRRRGGNTPNTAEVLQQLLAAEPDSADVEIVLVNVLPAKDSAASKFIAKSLGQRVNLNHCVYRENHTEPVSAYIISNAASDSRTIIAHNDIPEMTYDDFKQVVDELNAFRKKTLYHFEGRNVDVTLQCMRYIRENNANWREANHGVDFLDLISLEVEKVARPGLRDLANHADLIFYSKAWAQHEGYADASACIRGEIQKSLHLQPSRFVCTWGEAGSWSCADANDANQILEVAHADSEKIAVVDPVGAGDTFIAAMLFVLWTQPGHRSFSNDHERLTFANSVAARKIAQEGFGNLVPASGLLDKQ